jgi:hypothetical protein
MRRQKLLLLSGVFLAIETTAFSHAPVEERADHAVKS